jgi:hypothetical protein
LFLPLNKVPASFYFGDGIFFVLEINPRLAIFAPAIFPLLALTGAFTLALISQQEQRQIAVQEAKLERSTKRHFESTTEQGNVSILAKQDESLELANEVRRRRKDTFLVQLEQAINEHPEKGVTELKNELGVRSRSTVYSYLKQLESLGRIRRTQIKINE